MKKLDFTHPEQSLKYNPFAFIHSEQDVVKIAKILSMFGGTSKNEPFWELATELLLSALISYIWEFEGES
ncbi:MAG: hypothetical protein R3Y47_06080 [Lachnospiraceae bacterium]